jgi:hypothetical protein
VVFLHGLCLDRQSWTRQISYVRGRYTDTVPVISYDHQGQRAALSAMRDIYNAEDIDKAQSRSKPSRSTMARSIRTQSRRSSMTPSAPGILQITGRALGASTHHQTG